MTSLQTWKSSSSAAKRIPNENAHPSAMQCAMKDANTTIQPQPPSGALGIDVSDDDDESDDDEVVAVVEIVGADGFFPTGEEDGLFEGLLGGASLVQELARSLGSLRRGVETFSAEGITDSGSASATGLTRMVTGLTLGVAGLTVGVAGPTVGVTGLGLRPTRLALGVTGLTLALTGLGLSLTGLAMGVTGLELGIMGLELGITELEPGTRAGTAGLTAGITGFESTASDITSTTQTGL